MKRLSIPLAVVLLLVALTGCSSSAATIHGTMLLEGAATVWTTKSFETVGGGARAGDACWAMDGYTDIAPNAEVDITNSSGKVVGVGHLQAGREKMGLKGKNTFGCAFRFTVENVPTDDGIYGIRVGNSSRSVVHVSRADLTRGPLLNLGDGIVLVK